MSTPEPSALEKAQAHPLTQPEPLNEWQALGTVFEGLSKAGLALTIGFTVAAAFCKLADSGKINVSDTLATLAGGGKHKPPPEPRAGG